MPLYVGDYMAATSRLTTEQHGAYLLMIMDYWKNGPIPDDDAVICQITKLSPNAWSKSKALLLAFFERSNGRLLHHRVEKEKAIAITRVEIAHVRAVTAAEARWKRQSDAASNAQSNATSNEQAIPDAMLEDVLDECQSQSQSQSPVKTSHVGGPLLWSDGRWHEVAEVANG